MVEDEIGSHRPAEPLIFLHHFQHIFSFLKFNTFQQKCAVLPPILEPDTRGQSEDILSMLGSPDESSEGVNLIK